MRLIIGKARSGKTAAIIREIREAVQQGNGKTLLIVPEQYTHEAERELCEACGDRLSLYAEVMSFTGLARWGLMRFGGGAELRLDEGGKLLCMATALKELQPLLRFYGGAADNPELMSMMVREVDTLNAAICDAGKLRSLSAAIEGKLGEKLSEFAVIMEAYEAAITGAGATAAEPLAVLADQVDSCGLADFDRIYIDGFVDFTALEMAVLKAMLKRKANLTVCLTADERDSGAEYLLPSVIAMQTLKEAAEEIGEPAEVVPIERSEKESALSYFSEHMFDYGAESVTDCDHGIRLLEAANPREECEAAAAEILRAVREDGCRWRDIAVAVRGFEDYRGILENTFRRYEIPVFVTQKAPLAEKPLPRWMEAAYDIVLGNWDVDEVTAWLRCGFSGLDEDSCDELCGYLFRWQLRANDWLRPERWKQHPDGYGQKWDEEAEKRLECINRSRFRAAKPLLCLRDGVRKAETARQHAEALATFLREAEITTRLEERVQLLEQKGKQELAAEYRQLWDLCSNAIRQIALVLGDAPISAQTFRDLLHTVLSRYDIGLIPVSLDRVSAGDFDRMRRRNIRRLIVLGCSDDRLPLAIQKNGIFTSEERDLLAEYEVMIGGGDAELWREYALIFHTLSLPHEQLILSVPKTGLKGEKSVPAIVFHMAERLFSILPEQVSAVRSRLSARAPALTLAARAGLPGTGCGEVAALDWFQRQDPERIQKLQLAAERKRGSLSPGAVKALYGDRIRISPSRLEAYSDCRFGFYCSYGLKAEENSPAEFRAQEVGTFTHKILENTTREVMESGGFQKVSDEELRALTKKWIQVYIRDELDNFAEKSPRFRHLFLRLCDDVEKIILDTAEELRRSLFLPLGFELDISDLKQTLAQDRFLKLTGISDRVDGWEQDGKLYLRVVDYKTGKKKFSLSDVWYGRNMQMLLYLFAVSENAEELFGDPGIPAGILYLPAREELLSFPEKPDEETESKMRKRMKRRSGLVLDDPELIKAWESSEEPQFIPEKTKTVNPLVDGNQLDLLRQLLQRRLSEMAQGIQEGDIQASPGYQSESENACVFCPYHSICRFEEGENGDRSCLMPKLSDSEVWEKLREGETRP